MSRIFRPQQASVLSRRQLLKGCAAGAIASLAAGQAIATTAQTRTLSFVHTHTGESLRTTYCVNGCYEASSLQSVNQFLRDFRTGDVHAIDPTLLDILFELQVRADRDAEFQIISGYRSPQTNASLRDRSAASGVAKRSLHMDGMALDIRLTGFDTARLRGLAVSLQRGGVGYYRESDFVHIDTGRVRYW